MDKTKTLKKISDLDAQAQNIYIKIEKLREQMAIQSASDVLKSLPLFDYDYDDHSLKLVEKKNGSRDDYKAIDAAATGYHCTINLEEDIVLRIDDSDKRIQYMPTDYREMANIYEKQMLHLANFAKKHNLNVTYRLIERKIKQKEESLKITQEELLTFKRYMSTNVTKVKKQKEINNVP
jgi:hypothetical protein